RSMVAVGLTWFLVVLLPLLGIVGARVAAAQDRYLYIPLMGLMVAVAGACQRWLGPPQRVIVIALPILLAALCIPLAPPLCADCRDTLTRAQRVVARDPHDPRALELLAMAHGFSLGHLEPDAPQAKIDKLATALSSALGGAVRAAERPPAGRSYFKDRRDR